eukprot:Sdes_comp20385_c0_seq1m14294
MKKISRSYKGMVKKINPEMYEFPAISSTQLAILNNRPYVAVFGGSRHPIGSEIYQEGIELGKTLSELGFNIVNGGYFGSMESVSLGAFERNQHETSPEKHCSTVGILVPSLFPDRKAGNRYLSYRIESKTLFERLCYLVSNSECFICLPGSLGTLNELILVWNELQLKKMSGRCAKYKLILYRDPWEKMLESIGEILPLGDWKKQDDFLFFIDSCKDVEKCLSS